ncbi:MAG: response regulator [Anaerolineae bacterium]
MQDKDKAKILLVEDEAMVAMVMRWSLEHLGYAVCATVATGEDAVRAAQACTPDLVLMDVHLPGGLSGIEAAQQIATQQDVPFIFFSGYSEEEIAEQAYPLEPVACLSKPVETHVLASVIAEALNRS